MNLKQIAYEDGYDEGEATGRAEFVFISSTQLLFHNEYYCS